MEFRCVTDCQSLEKVELIEGLKEMESEVFNGCSSLRRVYVPSSVESMGERVFGWCTALEQVSLPEHLTTDKMTFNKMTFDQNDTVDIIVRKADGTTQTLHRSDLFDVKTLYRFRHDNLPREEGPNAPRVLE